MNDNNLNLNTEVIESDNELIDDVAVMLTTLDNPYDYFTQFDQWFRFDHEKGYNTCEYLDRIITKNGDIAEDMTQKEEDEAIERAIDEISQMNPLIDDIKIKKQITY